MTTQTTLNALRTFQNDAYQSYFYLAFGTHVGGHLWDKFSKRYKRNAVDFFHSLDEQNQKIMIEYLETISSS